tara:strand:+ start:291 stop:821 length:531 start_codon:yes stop_codon:yes gene_type:complete
MIKALNTKLLLTVMLGISFLSMQTTSIAVESNPHTDDVVIITVDSTNLQFSPSEVTINEGQTVRFFWSGEFLEHNAVSPLGIFSTGNPQTEIDYAFTFDKGTNNTYDFICEPHELVNMVGTITVNPAVEEEQVTSTNETMEAEQGDLPQSSNSLNGFLFIPAIGLVLFVSRYFRKA